MMFSNQRRGALIPTILSSILLSACGGGGSEGGSNNNALEFSSANTASVAENSTDTGYTASATGGDGNALTYSLTGGADQALFSIDPSSGVLSFASAPDYETPSDADSNNSYEVEITAGDGTDTMALTVTVSVTNTNEAPAYTSATTASIAENSTDTGYTASAIDADGDTISYSISGGADQALFSIDPSSGALSFVSAPDFEIATDSDTNNTYVVEITADDSNLSVAQEVTISVTDALEVTASSSGIKTIQFDWPAYSGATFYRLTVNPDGASGYSTLIDNISGTTTSISVPVHATDWVNATYVLEAHDGSGQLTSSDAVDITSAMLGAIGFFKASNPGASDNFGGAVALSADGTTLAVGSIGESSSTTGINTTPDDLEPSSGAVYIFRYNGSSWSQQAYIKASDTGIHASDTIGDLFGISVALSSDGNVLAVSAEREDGSGSGVNPAIDDLSKDSGAAYIFRYGGGNWSQEAYFKSGNNMAGTWYGNTLALSDDGTTLAVGEVRASGSGSSSGGVYVYRYSGSAWSQQSYITASNAGAGDRFGTVVALGNDGNTLAVGAPREASSTSGINSTPDDLATNAGAVYVYRYSGSSWSEQAYIKASNSDAHDNFGYGVELSDDGNTLAVVAPWEDSSTTGINSTPNNDSTDSGAAYLFRYDGTDWGEQAYIKASNAESTDYFGSFYLGSISLSGDGNSMVVGAVGERGGGEGVNPADDNSVMYSGAAYLFEFDGSAWAQQSYIKGKNTSSNDRFGYAVSVSGDGETLAIGAINEDSSTSGINPTPDSSVSNSGAVYVY